MNSAGPGSITSDSTSTSLLRRVQNQEPAAWVRLVDLYSPLVYYWCRQAGLQAADAADVLQEVFQAVNRSIAQFRRPPLSQEGVRGGSTSNLSPEEITPGQQPGEHQPLGSFRGWLWTITRNKIRDHFRRIRNRPQAEGGTAAQHEFQQFQDPQSDDTTKSPDFSPVFFQALQLVRAEFEDHTWQAFWLYTVEGRAPDQVAGELGISRNAVYKAKSRVLGRLRDELGDVLE